MFDVGFTEILVILVVGLIVVGPDRLPVAARTLGLWWGRIKYQLQMARRDFEKEMGADEIRRQLHNEQVMHELGESKEAIRHVMQQANESIHAGLSPETPPGSRFDQASDVSQKNTGQDEL
jgi:sec-independent protein translocase protein TatB